MSAPLSHDPKITLESEIGPPVTAGQLLGELGVDDHPIGEQRAAVARWLEGHGEASPILLYLLRHSGLIDWGPATPAETYALARRRRAHAA